MKRWNVALLVVAVFSLIAPVASYPAALSLYDDFSEDKIDAAKWQNLEQVREIRSGRLVQTYRVNATTNSTYNNNLNFNGANTIQAIAADVRLNQAAPPVQGFVRIRIHLTLYNDGTTAAGSNNATGDVRAYIAIRADSTGTTSIGYSVYTCGSSDCGAGGTTPVGYTHLVSNATLGQTYTLGIAWDGTATLTLSVNGSPTAVNVPVVTGVANVHAPGFDYKPLQTSINAGPAGGEGFVSGDFDNVYVNGALYDTFDGAPYSGPRLDLTKWANLDEVREVSGSRLVSKVAFTGAQYASRSSSTRFVNEKTVSAMRADITVTDYQSVDGSAQARLKGVYYNDGASTGSADQTGDVQATFHIRSDMGAPLRGFFTVWRCDDAACSTDHFLPNASDEFGDVNLGETHTVYLSWNGSVFEYGMDGILRTYDPRPYAPVVRRPVTTSRDLRTAASSWIEGAYAYMAATFDNVYVSLHPDAVGAFRPSDGTFYLDYNGSGTWDGCGTDRCLQIGMLGDVPLVGDWNGTGSSKVGAFRPSDGTFYLDYNGNGIWDGCGTDRCLQIGLNGDIPLVGDWNGTGSSKVGAFRPSDGTFYLDYNGNGIWDGCGTDRCLQIGLNGDIPLVGDWDGTGSSKVGAFRPSDGTFYLDYNGSGTWEGCGTDRCLQIGMNGDIPLVGDWNGSRTSKVGAFRPSDGTFYLDYNGSGTWEGCGTDRCLQIGMLGDVPLVGDWNGSGTSKVGAFRPSDGTFYLDYNGSGTWEGCGTDRCLQIGMNGDAPLVGKW